jgi:hypothetical protein
MFLCLCRADPNKSRLVLWQRVADTVKDECETHSRALATYALAHDACVSEDKENFEKYIHQTRVLWADLGNPTLPGFIERHINMGVCEACAAEMSGVMDGHEIRFKQFIIAQSGNAAGGNGEGASSSGGSGKGARLIPGGSEIEPASTSKGEPQARISPASAAASRAGIAALEQEMKKGYELYEQSKYVPCSFFLFHTVFEADTEPFPYPFPLPYQ